MGENGLSVADALALQNKGTNTTDGNNAFGANSAWWVIILILFFAFAGWGGNRNGNNNNCDGGTNTVVIPTNAFGGDNYGGYNSCCTLATQQGITDAFNFNQLDNGMRGLERGMCDGFYTTNLGITNLGTQMQQGFCSTDRANLQSFNQIGQTLNQGFNSVNQSLCQGFNGINSQLAQTNYNIKDCCCETRESIMQSNFNNQANFNSLQNQLASCCCELGRGQENIKYALAQSTCDIMANADKNTDRIINHLVQNEMDNLRTELQSAQLQLSQNAQTNSIVNQLLPVAKPAYITCSPYASAFGCGYGANPFGNNGNNCNSCC